MDAGLEGKIVLITGSARGIGFTTAQKFAAEKAEIIIVDLDLEMAKEAAAAITKDYGVPAYAYAADIGSVENIEKLFDEVKSKFGKIDVLVNNAGIQIRNPGIDFLEADWDKIMDINLKAVFFCCQQAARIMKDTGGAIVNISSGTSKRTTPGRAPYVISKSAVNSLTEVLACEWAQYGIRVNAVAPGWIMTAMVQEGFKLGVVSEKQLMAAIPFKRLADMSEIADTVLYLASKNASYVSGQIVFVDGGQTALGLPDIK